MAKKAVTIMRSFAADMAFRTDLSAEISIFS
jgi:hypothetical protein